MTTTEAVLSVLVMVVGSLAVAAQVRYLRLRRKHKRLSQLYKKVERQLAALWDGSAAG